MTSNIVMIANGQALAEGDLHRIRSLLDQFPHSIELTTTTPRLLGQVLAERPDVSSLQFPAEGKVLLQTTTPDVFYQDLPAMALREGIAISGVRSVDDSLEAVFRLLARR